MYLPTTYGLQLDTTYKETNLSTQQNFLLRLPTDYILHFFLNYQICQTPSNFLNLNKHKIFS